MMILVVAALTSNLTFIIMIMVDILVGLRVSRDVEIERLEIRSHGEHSADCLGERGRSSFRFAKRKPASCLG